jgi:hypothetical protein
MYLKQYRQHLFPEKGIKPKVDLEGEATLTAKSRSHRKSWVFAPDFTGDNS